MTRAEHLQWCKDRALEYLNSGDLTNTMTSMLNDMSKHEETKLGGSTEDTLMMLAALYIRNHDHAGMKRWIEGFN